MAELIKKAFFYTVPFILFIALVELVLYLIYVIEDQQTCADKWTTYGYCPGYSEVRDLSREKQAYTVVNVYIDALGARQPGPEPAIFPENGSVFIIGDSFVQADELPYELTMGGALNSNHVPAYALGYSSWNPIQYAGAIAKLGGLSGDYHVFMFINDFMPSYERSVAYELKEPQFEKGVWQRLTGVNRLAKLIDRKWKKIAAAQGLSANDPNSARLSELLSNAPQASFTREAFRQCGAVAAIEGGSMRSDILMFAKHHSCWPDEFRQAVDMAVDAIEQLEQNFEANVDGTLHLYLIPAGWSLPHQNTVGRVHPSLGLPDANIVVTQAGLVDYLQYRGIKIMDLELFLQAQLDAMAADCGACENTLYFEYDGHWTALTHQLIATEFLYSGDPIP